MELSSLLNIPWENRGDLSQLWCSAECRCERFKLFGALSEVMSGLHSVFWQSISSCFCMNFLLAACCFCLSVVFLQTLRKVGPGKTALMRMAHCSLSLG